MKLTDQSLVLTRAIAAAAPHSGRAPSHLSFELVLQLRESGHRIAPISEKEKLRRGQTRQTSSGSREFCLLKPCFDPYHVEPHWQVVEITPDHEGALFVLTVAHLKKMDITNDKT